jgi:hypothetical protein
MQIWKSTEKKLHIKLPNTVPVKSIESNKNQSSPAIPNSNPFESIIAPLLKVPIPHFHDQKKQGYINC